MRGDELVPNPLYVTTQAITIGAPPRFVWPWLVQMGAGRAGWYSFDRIDNGGAGSAESLVPAFQHVARGTLLPALPGATESLIVGAVEPSRDLILIVPGPDGRVVVSWEFRLDPAGTASSRLTVRARVSPIWRELAARSPAASSAPRLIERIIASLARLPTPLLIAVGGAGHRIMQSRQLRGIRRRAESSWRLAHPA